jgi:hypothetical protein
MLKKELYEKNNDLQKMKDEKDEEERLKWTKDKMADKNPYVIEYYRKKMEEKDKDIKNLTKKLKKV